MHTHQLMGDKDKTNLENGKLSEHIDTELSDIMVVGFTVCKKEGEHSITTVLGASTKPCDLLLFSTAITNTLYFKNANTLEHS